MSTPLRIVSIDGTRGAGKTSQIAMLSAFFKKAGLSPLIIKLREDSSIKENILSLQQAGDYLALDSSNAVLFDGSIARAMVVDLISGMPSAKLVDKYKELTHAYERVNHKYKVASFLMAMDDIAECSRRIEKHRSLSKLTSAPIENESVEKDVVSGMRFFNNHIASKNITFQVIDVDNTDTMRDLHSLILELLAKQYTMPVIKKDEDEW
jgi:thymidylate kinase